VHLFGGVWMYIVKSMLMRIFSGSFNLVEYVSGGWLLYTKYCTQSECVFKDYKLRMEIKNTYVCYHVIGMTNKLFFFKSIL